MSSLFLAEKAFYFCPLAGPVKSSLHGFQPAVPAAPFLF